MIIGMFSINFNKQLTYTLILFVLIIFLVTLFSQDMVNRPRFRLGMTPRNNIQCYRRKSLSTLQDISEIFPRIGKSIFFHETSCTSFEQGKISITSRQACAVESAAKMNPNLDVYLLYSSPGAFEFEDDESDQFLQVLLSYKNVRIKHLDYEKYTKDTPVEDVYSSGKIDNSKFAVSHASDVLRFLSLWKYGGIYLDLDTIVIKSLEELSLNFGGAESEYDLGSAVLSFDAVGDGHVLAENCLIDLKNNFNGEAWTNNGPDVINRIIHAACGGAVDAKSMIGKTCDGFTVYPQEAFYPLSYPSWEKFFDQNSLSEVLNLTKNSYVLHIWNKLSAENVLRLTSNAPYLYFAKRFCPKVVEKCDFGF